MSVTAVTAPRKAASAARPAAAPAPAPDIAETPPRPVLRLPEGLHLGVAERDYHADPAQEPSLSGSIARLLITRSPLHARYAHPRLNPEFETPEPTAPQEWGTVLHALVLGTPAPHRVLNVKAFQSNADKALRDETRRAGLIPVKATDMVELNDVASSLRSRIASMPEIAAAIADANSAGSVEVTLIARLAGVLCRGRYDILPPREHGFTLDLKFTGKSAETEEFGKTIESNHAIQAALYPALLRAIRGDRPDFLFLACETEAPYGVSVHGISRLLSGQAEEQIEAALDIWRECLSTGEWPGYPRAINRVDPKPWSMAKWEQWKMARDWMPAAQRSAR